jgi:hypothetical protein
MRPGKFRAALPVHTLTFKATSQPAQAGTAAAGVRVEHRVPDGSHYGDHNFVRAGPGVQAKETDDENLPGDCPFGRLRSA